MAVPAMADLGPVAWPPAPIRTERLLLRMPEARDRAAVIELFASPEVGTYIGGPRPRDELERVVPEVPRRRPGLFVIDLDGAMIGIVTLDRRDAERPGHVRPDAGEAELGYMLLPEAWATAYSRTRGVFPPLQPDVPSDMTAREREFFEGALQGQIYGTPSEVDEQLGGLVRRTAAVEVLITTNTYDRSTLLASYEALAELPADALL